MDCAAFFYVTFQVGFWIQRAYRTHLFDLPKCFCGEKVR